MDLKLTEHVRNTISLLYKQKKKKKKKKKERKKKKKGEIPIFGTSICGPNVLFLIILIRIFSSKINPHSTYDYI